MRLTLLALSALILGGLCACSTSDGPDSRSGLAETFNQALDEVYADGTFQRLMEQYFDYDLRPASRL